MLLIESNRLKISEEKFESGSQAVADAVKEAVK